MAEKKYLDEIGLQDVASHVNTRLKTVTTMPVSADNGAVRLYVGTTDTYIQGHIYQYNSTDSEWIDITSSGQFIQYSTMPTANVDLVDRIIQYVGATNQNYTNGYFYKCVLDNNAYIWQNITVQSGSGGSDNIINGYFNSSNNLFYEESTYTTPITGESNVLYISLDTDFSYRYNGSIFVRVDKEIDDSTISESKTWSSQKIFRTLNPSLVSWSTGTDQEISDMIDAYYNGRYTADEIKSVWSVGDVRNVNISAIAASGSSWTVGESHRTQTIQLQILDFEHDTLTTPLNGKTKALITVDLKNCLRDANVSDTQGSSNTENGYINPTKTNAGGWNSCARRAWCNNGFYNALPSYLKSKVKYVNKLTTAGSMSLNIVTTSDLVFLLAEIEIFGGRQWSGAGEGSLYALYQTAANRYKLPRYSSSYNTNMYWQRSPSCTDSSWTNEFCQVDYYCSMGSTNPSSARGIAPAFCL